MAIAQAAPLPAVNVADMYKRWTLDGLVDTAHAISNDFVERWERYPDVPDATQVVLADLKTRTGHEPDWPNQAQRRAIYGPFLGGSDGKLGQKEPSRFLEVAGYLRDAAVRYVKRATNDGEEALRKDFMDAVSNFRTYLTTINGAAVQRGQEQARQIFDKSVAILREQAVRRAFAPLQVNDQNWPLETGDSDGNGAYLYEEITRALASRGVTPTSRARFVAMQRVANRGHECINDVAQHVAGQGQSAQQVQAEKNLITRTYLWATALENLLNFDKSPASARRPE